MALPWTTGVHRRSCPLAGFRRKTGWLHAWQSVVRRSASTLLMTTSSLTACPETPSARLSNSNRGGSPPAGLGRMHDNMATDAERIAWNRAVNDVHELSIRNAQKHGPNLDRAIGDYFGDDDLGSKILDPDNDEAEDYAAGFATWAVALYRPEAGLGTAVEQLLASGSLDKRLRVPAEALRDGIPSIYRIDYASPTHATLLDLASGRRIRTTDPSWCIPGLRTAMVPGLLVEQGPDTQLMALAPFILDFTAGDIPDALEAAGIELSPEGLAAAPEFAGILARYQHELDELANNPSTDGGERFAEFAESIGIGVHKADFLMEDPQRVLRVFEEHPEVTLDPESGEYIWVRAVPGHRVRDFVARWDVIDDHLVVTCEADDSYADTLAMLESIPGVRLVQMHKEPFGLGDEDDDKRVPLDDLSSPRTDRRTSRSASCRIQAPAFGSSPADAPAPRERPKRARAA